MLYLTEYRSEVPQGYSNHIFDEFVGWYVIPVFAKTRHDIQRNEFIRFHRLTRSTGGE